MRAKLLMAFLALVWVFPVVAMAEEDESMAPPSTEEQKALGEIEEFMKRHK
jgi:hypothetical protein